MKSATRVCKVWDLCVGVARAHGRLFEEQILGPDVD